MQERLRFILKIDRMPVDFQQALPDKQAGMLSPFGGLYSVTKKKKKKKVVFPSALKLSFRRRVPEFNV